MSLEQTTCDDLKAIKRRLTEVIACLQPSTMRLRIIIADLSVCTATAAWHWRTDLLSPVVSLTESIWNHPIFCITSQLLLRTSWIRRSSPYREPEEPWAPYQHRLYLCQKTPKVMDVTTMALYGRTVVLPVILQPKRYIQGPSRKNVDYYGPGRDSRLSGCGSPTDHFQIGK